MKLFTTTHDNDVKVHTFIAGKSNHTITLLQCFLNEFNQVGTITVEATKTMIGISNAHKRIAWVTQLGKNFIHVVFPFRRLYEDNLCFQKVGQVPGSNQFNHHLRIMRTEDVNAEVKHYMHIAYNELS